MKKNENECSICHRPYQGPGNNAEPINSGRCCDLCDWKVIEARIAAAGAFWLTDMANKENNNEDN